MFTLKYQQLTSYPREASAYTTPSLPRLGSLPDETILFSITSGNEDGCFTIDASTGAVRVSSTAAIDFETVTAYQLRVVAEDKLGLMGRGMLNVAIVNVNEPPETSLATQFRTVAENTNAGHELGDSFRASDPEGEACPQSPLILPAHIPFLSQLKHCFAAIVARTTSPVRVIQTRVLLLQACFWSVLSCFCGGGADAATHFEFTASGHLVLRQSSGGLDFENLDHAAGFTFVARVADSAHHYTEEVSRKITDACITYQYTVGDLPCVTNGDGKILCDDTPGCTVFVRNSIRGRCYMYNIPTADQAVCYEVGPATHTQVLCDCQLQKFRATRTRLMLTIHALPVPHHLPLAQALRFANSSRRDVYGRSGPRHRD